METNDIFNGGLGLEMSLNHQQTPNFLLRHQQQQPQYTTAPTKQYDEEEPHSNNPTTTEDSGGDGKLRKGSPWQRMKWTDNMVRLLIMVVFYIGDEVGSDQQPPAGGGDMVVKKKNSGGGGGGNGHGHGVLQKKGKWKSVSNAMMERGFYVSPQQCEDKFNDLNKRYKRVNDILGKGIACKVVENQTLLESMDIPKKLKEEAKKLLNSKHLFFREMCAYHNSCAGGGTSGASGGPHHSSPPEVTATTNQRQICVHSNDDDADDDNDEGDDDVDEDEDDCEHFEEEDDGLSSRKRGRTMENDVMHQFDGELRVVMQDMTKSVWEKRQWMKGRMMQLEEQRVGYQGQSYELEKQRLKWLKFCYKKEREMEVDKLRNERMKLENERMVLLLKQKEMELFDLQHQYSSNVHKRTSDPSSING